MTNPAALRVRQSADPAAGVEASYIADEDEIVHAVEASLVTSATVAARITSIAVDDPATGIEYMRFGTPGSQAASLTRIYSAAAYGTAIDNAGNTSTINLPIPQGGIPLKKGHRLRTVTVNIQAGDNYGPMAVLAERL